ncbi:hypothetical protein Tco_0209341 [Tanacetum coccineum]
MFIEQLHDEVYGCLKGGSGNSGGTKLAISMVKEAWLSEKKEVHVTVVKDRNKDAPLIEVEWSSYQPLDERGGGAGGDGAGGSSAGGGGAVERWVRNGGELVMGSWESGYNHNEVVRRTNRSWRARGLSLEGRGDGLRVGCKNGMTGARKSVSSICYAESGCWRAGGGRGARWVVEWGYSVALSEPEYWSAWGRKQGAPR